MTQADQEHSLSVLMLAGDFYPKESGGAFIDWNVATYLAETGDDVTVVTPRSDKTPYRESISGVDIHRPFPGPGPDTHPNSLRGVFWRVLFVVLTLPYLVILIWRQDFDLVYSTNHLFHSLAALMSSVFQIPHISFVGYSPSIRNDVSLVDPLVLLERINFRFFMGDKTLCRTPKINDLLCDLSSAETERIDGIVDPDTIVAAAKSDEYTKDEFDSQGQIQLIFVGRLVGIKNPTDLPHLLNQLPDKYSMLVVGDGPQQSAVRAVVHELGVEERIRLTGRLPQEQALRAIHESDILILPSEVEAYPAVVFEALALNTPVLATPVGVLSTVNHPKLTTAPVDSFTEVLSAIDVNTKERVDKETLQQFSVNKFSHNIRSQMLTIMPETEKY